MNISLQREISSTVTTKKYVNSDSNEIIFDQILVAIFEPNLFSGACTTNGHPYIAGDRWPLLLEHPVSNTRKMIVILS